jgi:hypothetical protein
MTTRRRAAVIVKNPPALRAIIETIKRAHEALVDILGADGAAAAILKNSAVLRASFDTIKGAHEALTPHLCKDVMLQAIKAGDKIHQTSIAIKGLLRDSEVRRN